jgi:hypothetical protein
MVIASDKSGLFQKPNFSGIYKDRIWNTKIKVASEG